MCLCVIVWGVESWLTIEGDTVICFACCVRELNFAVLILHFALSNDHKNGYLPSLMLLEA